MLGLKRLRRRSSSGFSYVPISQLEGRSHLMVDGAARPGTVATLSHWPRSSTPDDLRMDLSAEIVLRSLETGYLDTIRTDVVTIDHYDEDGVIALSLVIDPGLAERHADLLTEAARIGDFGVVNNSKAALVAFALASLGDPRRSTVEEIRMQGVLGNLEQCRFAATTALELIGELADNPNRFTRLWKDEAAAFSAGRAGLGHWATIEELAQHDLAIVRIDPQKASGWGDQMIHPAAVSSETSCMRVATVADGHLELRFRYESWVRMVTSRPRPRVDLTRLAAELEDLEPGHARWRFDGASATRPALHTVGHEQTGITADVFVEKLTGELEVLDRQRPAWDPYAD